MNQRVLSRILLLMLPLAWVVPRADATHYKLFVLTGQSNSLGTTLGGEADPSPGTDPADTKVPFYWSNYDGAGTFIGDSGGVFTDLQDQQGSGPNPTFWGPEIEFGRALYRAGVRDFGIIKASRGGGGNGHWVKGSGAMYTNVVNAVNAATTELLNGGHSFEIVGLLYLQGESDDSTEAAAAGTRLMALVDNLRADLPQASLMHAVAGGIAAATVNDDTVRANQAAIAASTAYIDYFENLDLQGQLYDGLHFDKAAKVLIGERYAQAFFGAGVVSRHYGKLVFIGDSITQGGNGRPSYRYQVFKRLAEAGVPIDAATGYLFTGSQTGAYQNNAGSTPDVAGQVFSNVHDGHWGWRAFWENARVALPGGRYNVNNLGQGTVENWTGQATTFETGDQGTLTYTGSTYVPDTVSIMIGINDTGTSSATQVRDDIATMIDQLRAANAGVRIHLCELLYSNNVAYSTVDSINALLPQLVSDKNAASATSPVWLIEANDGFNASTMTYDNTHPNTTGEEHVGDRIAAAIGLIETPQVAGSGPVVLEEKAGDRLGCLDFEGSDIWNTGSYANGWSVDGGFNVSAVGESDLRLQRIGTSGDTLNGTNTGWSDLNDEVWTVEAKLKFDANPNGFVLWLGTGTHRILIEIYGDRTQDLGAGVFNVAHDNLDGQFHTWTVTHEPSANVYHVWRDGVLLTPPAGAAYDQTGSDERLLFGDYTSGTFGDGFDVTIDAINICRGFKGNEIYDGSSFINGWAEVADTHPSLVNTDDLRMYNTATTGGCWLEGTNTGWSDANDGYWTWEARMKFDALPEGFILWLATGSKRILVEIYADRTQDYGNNTFNEAHNNVDGQFHNFRVAHDPVAAVYHVWRDGERLTPPAGAGYDASAADERMILGDSTGGDFGDGFDVTFDYLRVDTGNAYLPPGADADTDGMPDLWEDAWFGDIVAGDPNADDDGDGKTNLEEYLYGTNPLVQSSCFEVESIGELVAGTWSLTLSDTSAERLYTLYVSLDLGLTDPWTPVPGQGPVAGNGGQLVLEHSTALAAMFYRVEVAVP